MSRGGRVRVFAAVELPDALAQELVRWGREALAAAVPAGLSGRVLRPGSLHLTVCFLGARPVAEVSELAAALEPCVRALGELELGAPVWLPPRRPRTLAVEVSDPHGLLSDMQADAARALRAVCDWQPRPGRYRPHVTVIRAREAGRAPALTLPPTPRISFAPATLSLLRSHLEPEGARYEALASYPLEG